MAYSKTTWINNSSPAINETNLNHIETGIDEAHDHIDNITTGHDHDGTDSKKVTSANVVNVAAGTIVATDAQAAIDELDTEKVAKATFDANTVLAANTDNTPAAVTVTEQTLVGRITAGNIKALSVGEAQTLINVENGADVTDATNVDVAGAVMESDFNAHTILAAVGDNTPAPITVAASRLIGRTAASDIEDITGAEARTILSVEENADVTDAVNVASSIHGVAAKATPVDADEVGLVDSAAADVLKKLTWTNIKATLKTYFDSLYIGNVSEDATPQLGGDLDLVNYEILLDSTPGTDHTGSGLKGTFTNGNAGSVAFGDLCYMALDGHLEFVDADADTSMPGLYMALGTIAAAASGEWMIMGVVRDDTWNWTIGPGASGLIYATVTATTGNTLSQTAPSATGDQVQIVGTALSADVMMFSPSPVLVEIA